MEDNQLNEPPADGDNNLFLSPSSPAPSNTLSPHERGRDASHGNLSDISATDSQTLDGLDNSISFAENNKQDIEERQAKRRSDEGFELRDELDFEEAERESGEEDEEEEEEELEEEVVSEEEDEEARKERINREEGELTEEEEEDPSMRQEPKTVCRFFNKGQCTWGTNCRFLHPGVSDKGNYNMFAPAKTVAPTDNPEESPEKEHPREIRRFVPEPSPFETAWERGLRYAKEMMKRASKRKETDADFEEKRFNLSLGQAELDRENDYYTRPASPVYKPSDEVIECLDPYEKQAIRHFRGGHFENFEVRYNVDPSYPTRGGHVRSRREKYEREVTERVSRRARAASPVVIEQRNTNTTATTKEKRYPRPRPWNEDRGDEAPPPTVTTKGEAEVWDDPWARRKTPVRRTKKKSKASHTPRSYSSGSSSKSSRSSRSSSYSSYSRSRSKSSHSSRSSRSRSSSRSITPPIHPRQRALARGRGGRGDALRGRPTNNLPSIGTYGRAPMPRRPDAREMRDIKEPRLIVPKVEPRPGVPDVKRAPNLWKRNEKPNQPEPHARGAPNLRKPDLTINEPELHLRAPIQRKLNSKTVQPEVYPRLLLQKKIEQKHVTTSETHARPPMQKNFDPKQPDQPERVDMFGRTIRKDVAPSPPRSPLAPSPRPHARSRKFSVSRSRSRSHSSASRSSFSSRSRSKGKSKSRSRSRSSSSGSSSVHLSPANRKRVDRNLKMTQGTVSYGTAPKFKATDISKAAAPKQIQMPLKKAAVPKPTTKPALNVDDDSGESDIDARILKKRKADVISPDIPPLKAKRIAAQALSAAATSLMRKPTGGRREELLKQLRAVEDAIARKRGKPPV